MTESQLNEENCKDFKSAVELVSWWNAEDNKFPYVENAFYWKDGVFRSRLVKRPDWKEFRIIIK